MNNQAKNPLPHIGSNKIIRIIFWESLNFELLYSTFYSDPSIEKAMQKTLEISTVILFAEQNEEKVI